MWEPQPLATLRASTVCTGIILPYLFQRALSCRMGSFFCLFLAGFLFGLFFDPEDGGSAFLPNVCWFLHDYMTLHPARQFFIVTTVRMLNPTCSCFICKNKKIKSCA
jgi:hypothetical protein